MRLVLLGGPASGKGTQAQRLATKFHIPQISSGDLLRNAIKTKENLLIKKYLDQGSLVPDNIVMTLLKKRIAEPDCAKGYLLDGFPRTMKQLQAFKNANQPGFFSSSKETFPFDHVIDLRVSDAVILARITGRLIHLPSGRTYHKEFNPPKVLGKDDLTGEPLVVRSDDNMNTTLNRLETYHMETEPLGQFFQYHSENQTPNMPKYHKINGDRDATTVYASIIEAVQSYQNNAVPYPKQMRQCI